MEYLLIVFLVLLGVLLVVAEVLLLPGITLAAIGAVASFIGAIVIAYNDAGMMFASAVFLASCTLTIVALSFSLRAKTLRKIALDKSIKSSVASDASAEVEIGAEGMSLTRLSPMGTVEFASRQYQGRSRDGLIVQKSKIKVISIEDNILVVEQIS